MIAHIARAALSNPNRAAVVSGGQSVSYEELERESSLLAGYLSARGISAGSIVAIYMPRSAAIVTAILGICKAGAAYTIVEDDARANSEEVRRRMVAMSPAAVIVSGGPAATLSGTSLPVIHLHSALGSGIGGVLPAVSPDDVMYVIYTSGSTGPPKGVAITHANASHYTEAVRRRLGIDACYRYAYVSSLAADLGNTSLFLSLWTGGTLHILDDHQRRDPSSMIEYLENERIDVLKITPSHWSAIFGAGRPWAPRRPLKYLVLGGETLTVPLAKRILESGATEVLANHYGPTETTVGVAAYLMRDATELDTFGAGPVPIGKPLDGNRAVVLDSSGAFHESGATGELYIGGPQVGFAYVNQPSSPSVVTGIAGSGGFYKTGDLVRVDETGRMTFLGRIDRQVKTGGYRVEPEYIEAALNSTPGVLQACVLPFELSGTTVLVASVAFSDEQMTEAALRSSIERRLPRHMIPSRFERFDLLPLTPNGKVDSHAVREIVARRLQAGRNGDDPVLDADNKTAEILSLWRRLLHRSDFGLDDDFFELGGDSLTAIQMIAELQAKGYDISARAFRNEPRISVVAAGLRKRTAQPVAANSRVEVSRARSSGAQRWFFDRKFANSDHWNQAILLEFTAPMNVSALEGAASDLLDLHPLLHTTFKYAGEGDLETGPAPAGRTVTVSECTERDEDAVALHIRQASETVQREIRLAEGPVFRLHLFQMKHGQDQLLAVAHHLSVDGISWRIVIDEFLRLYDARCSGTEAGLYPPATKFWEWVEHLLENRTRLLNDLHVWQARHGQDEVCEGTERSDGQLEGAADTVWMRLSREETRLLTGETGSVAGVHPSTILLTGFARALASGGVRIEIETHGRTSFSDDIDVSRVVGWFTAAFPTQLQVGATAEEDLKSVQAVVETVPHHGAGFGLLNTAPEPAIQATPRICFNYLGAFRIPPEFEFDVKFSRYPIARARGATNQRAYELVFTARILDGQLVADLSYPRQLYSADYVQSVMSRIQEYVLGIAGAKPNEPLETVSESGSAAGLLAYAPRALALQSAALQRHAYRKILLTGATGFVGIHVLRELLSASSAEVLCIVREGQGESPYSRLADNFSWYFGSDRLFVYHNRCRVLPGDVAAPQFGLTSAQWKKLVHEVDAIYHFAADTRLLTSRQESEHQELASVATAIELAQSGRPKDLHFMSTLAVCGVNAGARSLVFSERSFDIGQEFQNEYERSKWLAERLVRSFINDGGRGFIYRSGNVSGHSETGRFQRNPQQNRFVQFLATVVAIGELPETLTDTIRLSPVDTVARGIVRLSLCPRLLGGTFHVDAESEVSAADLFHGLANLEVSFRRTSARTFEELFARHVDSHRPEVLLGYFWSKRQARNIQVSNARTLAQLERLGCVFQPVTSSWLDLFLKQLIECGALPGARQSQATASN